MNVNFEISLSLHNGRVLDAKGAEEIKLGRLEKGNGILWEMGDFYNVWMGEG